MSIIEDRFKSVLGFINKITIDDIILDGLLIVTTVHSYGILSDFEIEAWQAWPLAIMLDVSVVRMAWVASNRNVINTARYTAVLGLLISLATSFGMNFLHYQSHNTGDWKAFWFASIFPLLMAILAAVKSFIGSSNIKSEDEPPVDFFKLYTDTNNALTTRVETSMRAALTDIQDMAHRIPLLVSAEIANQTHRPETAYTVTPILGKAPVSHSIVKSQAIGSRIDKNTAKQTAFDMFDNKQSIRSVATTTGWSVGAVSEWRSEWNKQKVNVQ